MLVNCIGDSSSIGRDPRDMSMWTMSALTLAMRFLQSSASCTTSSWPFSASAKIGSAKCSLASL